MILNVVKSNGSLVPFDANKLNRWAEWASNLGVDWASIALEACRKCFDGCTTKDLQQAMVTACVDRETLPYLRMAGRLYIGGIYKQAFGGWQHVPTLKEMYHKMTALQFWAEMDYTHADLVVLGSYLVHERDLQATLTEIKQTIEKYAVFDRVDGRVYESPQFVYMRMAMGAMEQQPKDRRINDVIHLYEYLSTKKINAPTPFSINLGTPKKKYASCCVYTTEDTAASLAAGDHIAYMMTCASAGIGAHLKTRSRGDKVNQGMTVHMGKLPYYKVAQASVGANIQASRGGALTMHYNVLDPEVEELLVLRNVQTIPQKQIKDIDYSFGFNEEFARRVAKNENWMLVSYKDSPALYEAMYDADQSKFVSLYAEIEKDITIPKKFVPSRDIAVKMLTESEETGRQYWHRTDELNRHTPFKDKIYSSNLC